MHIFCYFLDCLMPHAILHGMGMFSASITYMRIRERDNNHIFMNQSERQPRFPHALTLRGFGGRTTGKTMPSFLTWAFLKSKELKNAYFCK
jgi:hypothetical protein